MGFPHFLFAFLLAFTALRFAFFCGGAALRFEGAGLLSGLSVISGIVASIVADITSCLSAFLSNCFSPYASKLNLISSEAVAINSLLQGLSLPMKAVSIECLMQRSTFAGAESFESPTILYRCIIEKHSLGLSMHNLIADLK
jgi:hypothetical protein